MIDNRVCNQKIENIVNDKKYYSFSKLFINLPSDTSLKEQWIESRTYNDVLLDTCFYPYLSKIPFFYPYAKFKFEKPNGTLYCILHDCPAEMTDLRIVEFVTYNNEGVRKNTILLPYEKSGWFSPNPEDFFRTNIYTSNNQILLIQTTYTKKDNRTDNLIIRFGINEDAVPVMMLNNYNTYENN